MKSGALAARTLPREAPVADGERLCLNRDRRVHRLQNRLRELARSGLAAHIPGQRLTFAVDLLDTALYALGSLALIDVVQHQHRAL
jgi:hypothetical protein